MDAFGIQGSKSLISPFGLNLPNGKTFWNAGPAGSEEQARAVSPAPGVSRTVNGFED